MWSKVEPYRGLIACTYREDKWPASILLSFRISLCICMIRVGGIHLIHTYNGIYISPPTTPPISIYLY